MDSIKVGIVGCGVISPTHIEAFRKIENVDVTWLCDLEEKKASDLAARHKIANTTTEASDLIGSDVDIVAVCTDHASHADLCCESIEAGKHVLCEKALAQNQTGLDRIIAAADSHPDIVFSGVFQHRFDAVNRKIRQLIEEGVLGQMLTASIQMHCLRTNDYYRADRWRGTWAQEGGSVLINQAIHYIDLLRWTMGGVRSLTGLHSNLTHSDVIETEDTAVAAMTFKNGALGTLEATSSSHIQWEPTLTYHGTEGSIEMRNDKPVKIIFESEELTTEVKQVLENCRTAEALKAAKGYYGSGHSAQVADFVDSIRNHRRPFVSAHSAAKTVDMVLSLYQSQRTATPVSLRKDL